MANVGKMTLYVTQTQNGQQIAVRTTGKRGSVLLNTISENLSYTSQSPSPDANTFWLDVLNKVIATI